VLQVVLSLVYGCPSNSTQITDGCDVEHTGQLLCFGCMQAITADTVIAYITHDDHHNIPLASSLRGAKTVKMCRIAVDSDDCVC